jgi:hypothetical protein
VLKLFYGTLTSNFHEVDDTLKVNNKINLRDFFILFLVVLSIVFIMTDTSYAASNDTRLNKLTIDGVAVPGFNKDITTYLVIVGGTITSATIGAKTENGHATLTGIGTFALSLGNNVFHIVVTAEDGVTTRTYTLTIRRGASNSNLSDITINSVTITGFNPLVTSYALTVSSATTSVSIGATTAFSGATVTGIGTVNLVTGDNTVNLVVTAEDQTAQTVYALHIYRVSNDARLSALTVNGVTVSGFDRDVTTYLVTVGGTITNAAIGAETENDQATLTGTGTFALSLGNNVYHIVVTAEDGVTTNTYSLTIRRGDTNSKLSAITIDSVTISGFNPLVTSYRISVSSETSSVTIGANAASSEATISGTGTVSLTTGDNTVHLVVTAQDQTTQTNYTLNIYRDSNNDATLADLTVNGVTVSGFTSDVTTYLVTVGGTITNAAIEAKAKNDHATLKGTGSFALSLGNNVFQIVVTAEDGITKKTYTLTIRRGDSNSKLSSITIDSTKISGFNPLVTSYNISVSSATSSVSVGAATAFSGAMVSGIGTVYLATGDNTVHLVVTAQDQTTQTIYTLHVYRDSNNDATLSDLAVNGVAVSGFNRDVTTYLVTVGGTITNAAIGAKTKNDHATLKGTGNFALSLGNNVFYIVVTAEDGVTKKTYILTIGRGDSNSKLSDITIDSAAVAGFNPLITSYSLSVSASTASIAIGATPAFSEATVTGTGTVNLATGNNTVQLVVTAQDQTTQTIYTLLIYRDSNHDATLSDLTANGVTVSGFKKEVTTYLVTVGGTITNVAIAARTENDQAKVKGTGSFALNLGNNVFHIVVTAEDGVTTKTYALTVARGDSSQPSIVSISPDNNHASIQPAIELNFSENVIGTDKYILIKKLEGNTVQEYLKGNSYRVKITGQKAVIDLQKDLDYGTTYYVVVEGGAFTDIFGNQSIAINGNYWQFSTEADPDPQNKNEPGLVDNPEPELKFRLLVKTTDADKKPVNGIKVEFYPDSQNIITNDEGIAFFSDFNLGTHRIVLRSWKDIVIKEYAIDIELGQSQKDMILNNGVYEITLTPGNTIAQFVVQLDDQDVKSLTDQSPTALFENTATKMNDNGQIEISIPQNINVISASSDNAQVSVENGKIIINYDKDKLVAQNIKNISIRIKLNDNTVLNKVIKIQTSKFSLIKWYNAFENWQKIMLSGMILVLFACAATLLILISITKEQRKEDSSEIEIQAD